MGLKGRSYVPIAMETEEREGVPPITRASPFPSQPAWYAVSTRSRQEKTAAAMLDGLGIRHFLPLIEEERRWSDRRKVVAVPLFPGYLFVQIARTTELQLGIRKIPGVVDFVGNNQGPLPVPKHEVENVQALLSRGTRCAPHPFLRAGDRVRVVGGALAGIEGTYVRSGAESVLVLSVELIQRSVSVKVPFSEVEAVRQRDHSQVESSNKVTQPGALGVSHELR
jgi:transcription antitermination factor NusG